MNHTSIISIQKFLDNNKDDKNLQLQNKNKNFINEFAEIIVKFVD